MKDIIIIFKKDFVECIRDKKSMIMMIVSIMVFPLMISIVGDQLYNVNDITQATICINGNDNIQSNIDETNSVFSSVIPVLLMLFTTTGATGIALDTFCGEKERKTLEGILSTQINRKHLYFAKSLNVYVFLLINAIVSILGCGISLYFNNNTRSMFSVNGGLLLANSQILCLSITIFVFGFFCNSCICLLSISAKSIKEGSLLINLFSFIPALVSIISLFSKNELNMVILDFIPIVNIVKLSNEILSAKYSVESLIFTIVANIAYGAVLVFLGYKYIDSEKVLM